MPMHPVRLLVQKLGISRYSGVFAPYRRGASTSKSQTYFFCELLEAGRGEEYRSPVSSLLIWLGALEYRENARMSRIQMQRPYDYHVPNGRVTVK